MNDRLKIFDLWFDPVDMDQALERIDGFIKNGDRPHSILAVNPEKTFSVPKDPFLLEAFKEADLLVPDGIGVVLAARFLYGAQVSRVASSDLMEHVSALAAREGYGLFIFGSREEVNAKAAEVLAERYPGLKVVGRSDGYVDEEGMPGLIKRINESGAAILFLALGSPKQERWYAEHRNALTTVRVCQGIGGTLDTLAGRVKRAPQSWQNLGLEWLYRLLAEPKRIKRQILLPAFACRVLWAKFMSMFRR